MYCTMIATLVLDNTSVMSHNYFLFVVGTITVSSLSNFEVYNRVACIFLFLS